MWICYLFKFLFRFQSIEIDVKRAQICKLLNAIKRLQVIMIEAQFVDVAIYRAHPIINAANISKVQLYYFRLQTASARCRRARKSV